MTFPSTNLLSDVHHLVSGRPIARFRATFETACGLLRSARHSAIILPSCCTDQLAAQAAQAPKSQDKTLFGSGLKQFIASSALAFLGLSAVRPSYKSFAAPLVTDRPRSKGFHVPQPRTEIVGATNEMCSQQSCLPRVGSFLQSLVKTARLPTQPPTGHDLDCLEVDQAVAMSCVGWHALMHGQVALDIPSRFSRWGST